jgi:hypothetical protein
LDGGAVVDKGNVSFLAYDDYAQSANTLFNFMKEEKYLKGILQQKAIKPRYCVETVDYLNIHKGDIQFNEVAVLQKCFCDIPFHKLADTFPLNGTGENFEKLGAEEKAELERNNTHFDYYGKYAIAFSKTWCEQHNFQPIHYLNKDSHYTEDFRNLFQHILTDTDVLDQYVQDVINRLSYIKPLRGIMKRKVRLKGVEDIEVELYKNFHDEREWRYVPKSSSLEALSMGAVIANPKMVALHREISQQLEDEKYSELWLKFSYDDIRYIIVPDAHSRINIIKEIMDLPMEKFDDGNNIELQKQILISKILVLDEIRRDW